MIINSLHENYEFEIYDLFKQITFYILKYISNFFIDIII